MPLFRTKKRTRVCVIGLDGVPHGMVLDLAGRGVMPAMSRLLGSGRLHRMKASLPEISAVSWTDFMTGTDSGTHGIFGFTDFRAGSYSLRFPNFSDVRTPTIWDTLGDGGKRSVVINQPSTYPARKINGVLVSGFVAVDLAKAVWPAPRLPALERIGYRVDIDTLKARGNPGVLREELKATLNGQRKALELFWREDWDFFEFVVTGTDRLHHFLWLAYADPAHPFHGDFLDYYREVDGLIAWIVEGFRKVSGGEEGLFLLSDHGFTGIVQEVYLNAWLEQNGYLRFDRPDPEGLEAVSAGTSAFALDPGRIYLHRRGRFPRGAVVDTEKDALRMEIARKLELLEHGGRKVVRKVFYAEEAYSGPLAGAGPDLLVVGEPGFDMKGSVKKREVFGRTDLQGMHTWDDAFFWAARDMGRDLAIRDLAGIILKAYR